MPIRVAVIMPFQNSENTILKSVNSVLNQTDMRGCSITLLCVNDGSTDSSVQLVSSAVQEPTRSIIILDGPGKGPADARNVALEHVRSSDYTHVAFCDSDDVWYSWHLGRSLMYLAAYGVDMMYSDVDCENELGDRLTITGIPSPAVFDRALLRSGNYIFISSVVMAVNCISVGNFDPDSVPMEDWEYWLRVSDSYKIGHMHKPGPGIIYMWKSTGSYYTAEDSQRAKLKILDKMSKDPMSIEGWLSKNEGEFLARNAAGRKCIEIGSYKGKSANFIASQAKTLVCIDTFLADGGGQSQTQSPVTYVEFAANTSHLKNVTPLVGLSQDVHPLLKNDEFEFIFIDGMHDYDSVMNDVKNYLPKLKDGAIIMFHDYFERDWPGVVFCVNQLFGGPDELVDTVAKVVLTQDRRFELAIKFAGMSLGAGLAGPDLVESVGPTIVVAPWAARIQGVPNNPINPKNYPYWSDVVKELRAMGCRTIQIGRDGEASIGCDETRFNLSDAELAELLTDCATFVSVDSFLPHFAAYHGKKGVVIFGQSDPKIFGHSIHVNLLKSGNYLRPDQFRWWNDVVPNNDAFVTVNQVVAAVSEFL